MSAADSVTVRFARLFQGNSWAWGTEIGGCERGYLDITRWHGHLDGSEEPIGVYCVVPALDEKFVCRWGACDIDYDDIQEAVNFHDLLAQVGIPSYIERSRSKGYHVWVFVEDWISAETMRHALLVVRDFLKMEAREIYPKQTTLKEDELGNYLRLPYPGWLGNKVMQGEPRRVMLEPAGWEPVGLNYFLDVVEYADPKALEKLASRYTPPVVSEVRWHREAFDNDAAHHDYIARAVLNRLEVPLAWHIYMHGPIEGGDRSSTLMRLCNMVMAHGATMEEAFSIIWSADSKDWGGKYVDRYDGEMRVRQLVERVYASQGSPADGIGSH